MVLRTRPALQRRRVVPPVLVLVLMRMRTRMIFFTKVASACEDVAVCTRASSKSVLRGHRSVERGWPQHAAVCPAALTPLVYVLWWDWVVSVPVRSLCFFVCVSFLAWCLYFACNRQMFSRWPWRRLHLPRSPCVVRADDGGERRGGEVPCPVVDVGGWGRSSRLPLTAVWRRRPCISKPEKSWWCLPGSIARRAFRRR